MRLTYSIVLFSIVTLGPTSEVWAQTNEEAFEQFQWQVSTPGARANAMGGAFVASADDTTAGVINPAGLINVGRPQVSVEFMSSDLRVGRFATVESLVTGALTTSSDTTNSISFVSIALPLRSKKVAIALTGHKFLDYQSSFHLSARALPGLTGVARATSPVDSQIGFRAVSYAASIGVAVHDSLRFGLSVSLDRLRADSLNTKHDITVGRNPFDLTETAIVTNQSRINDSDTGFGLTVGAIYQPLHGVSFGAVYAKGPSFRVSEDFQLNPGRQTAVNQPLASEDGFPTRVSLNVPDRLSGGIAWRPHSRLLVAFDAAHLTYSDLARGLTPIVGHDFVTANDFKINDATEVHFGGEFNAASEKSPVFLRGGLFTNHDHRLRFVGNVQPNADITAAQAQRINVYERSVFNLGKHETEVKGTFGGGLPLGRHGELDVAYVWKERFLVSLGLRL